MSAPVSIVMAVYNREQYVAAAIESVLAQTYRDFEFVIWDDGSTDGSLEIARKYDEQDERIRLIAAPHQGAGVAMNRVFEQTTGKYMGYVDSDDLLAPEALEKTAAALDKYPQVGLVYTDYIEIDEKGKEKRYGRRCRIQYSKEKLLTSFMVFHFRLMRRDPYEQVGGFNEYLEAALDYDLCLRLSEVTTFAHLKKPLYYYRIHSNSISQGRKLDQIYASRDAINQALKRRGMDKEYELDVQLYGRFTLKKKQSEGAESPQEYAEKKPHSPNPRQPLSMRGITKI
jgi:glycosyltransferase involved in cell wall biosynthesis